MTEPVQPIRWREDASGAPDGVADALRTYAAARGSVQGRALLSERLAPLLATPAPSQRAIRSGRPWALTRLMMVVVVVVLASFVMMRSPRSKVSERSPHTSTQRAVVRDAAPAQLQAVRLVGPTSPPVVAPAQLTQQPSAAAAPAPDRARARPRRLSPAVARRVRTSPDAELELLRKAQQALTRMPSAAQAQLDAHARDYPDGLFVQEREMLRIELAVARGEHAQSRALARNFSKRFPGSTYQSRLELLLAHDSTIE